MSATLRAEVISVQGRRDRKADDVFGAQPEILVAQIPEGASEERSAGEQQHGEGHLSGHQHFAKAHVRNAGRHVEP